MSVAKQLRESFEHIAAVEAARCKVVEAAKAVARSARRSRRIHWTNVDRDLQLSVDALQALENKR